MGTESSGSISHENIGGPRAVFSASIKTLGLGVPRNQQERNLTLPDGSTYTDLLLVSWNRDGRVTFSAFLLGGSFSPEAFALGPFLFPI